MPQIEVTVYATLREHLGGKASIQLEIEPGETPRQVLARLDVPTADVKLLFVDAKPATLDAPLDGAEKLAIFPLIAGG